jgi:formylglycine-generating enzyme required for sulfatase activity
VTNVLPRNVRKPRLLCAAVLVMCSVGAVFGAAFGAAFFFDRGPDMAYIPPMANAPVITEDGRTIYVQATEVTIEQWNRCHEDGACELSIRPPQGQDPALYPATGLNWLDVNQYLRWINTASRHPFRLPTAAEWYHMAAPVLPDAPDPLFSDPALRWASGYLIEGLTDRELRPIRSFATTQQGIADLNGSVWEWTQDCYSGSYSDNARASCPAYIVVGEHQAVIPFLVRDPERGGCAVGSPPPHLGMRLVSDEAIPAV